MLLPISNMVAFATKSGQDRVTRLHHCNPPLLFASAVYELLYHLDVVLSRGGHHTGSNVHGSNISDSSVNVAASTATLVRSIATMLLLIGSQWCIFRSAIVGLVFAASATRVCRYAVHRTRRIRTTYVSCIHGAASEDSSSIDGLDLAITLWFAQLPLITNYVPLPCERVPAAAALPRRCSR